MEVLGQLLLDNVLTTFHPFPRLPEELRRYIWKLASLEPRILALTRGYLPPPPGLTVGLKSPIRFVFCRDPVPVTLHTCRESRTEAETVFGPAFASAERKSYIWTNFQFDTIMCDDRVLGDIRPQDRAQIRKAVVECWDIGMFVDFHLQHFSSMVKLTKLDIISGQRLAVWSGAFRKDKAGLEDRFESWFGGVDGWVYPEVKIIQKETRVEMSKQSVAENEAIRSRERPGGPQIYRVQMADFMRGGRREAILEF